MIRVDNKQEQKRQVGKEVLKLIPDDEVIGIGTGSTVDYFIAELATIKHKVAGVVTSSLRSTKLLEHYGFSILEVNSVQNIAVYVDGADEINIDGYCIKGGGGAHTREKIVAACAEKFICIVDESKLVKNLGKDFPLAIEVIPDARSYVGRACVKLGANPVYRDGFVTDSGNIVIDVFGLDFTNLTLLNSTLNNITGVVCHGLFVDEKPDLVLVGGESCVRYIDINS